LRQADYSSQVILAPVGGLDPGTRLHDLGYQSILVTVIAGRVRYRLDLAPLSYPYAHGTLGDEGRLVQSHLPSSL
jgi:hypothetical protein